MTPTQKIAGEQDAIKQAVEAGYGYGRAIVLDGLVQWERGLSHVYEQILLAPAFWQALGKTRGWKPSEGRKYAFTYVKFPDGGVVTDLKPEIGEWQYHALRYFETKLSAGDTQTYWQNLP